MPSNVDALGRLNSKYRTGESPTKQLERIKEAKRKKEAIEEAANEDARKERFAKEAAQKAADDKAAGEALTKKWVKWSTGNKLNTLQQGFTLIGDSNPPFDPRILNLPMGVAGTKFYRGAIVQARQTYEQVLGRSKPFRLNFLYNPEQVAVQYNGNPNVLGIAKLTDAQKAGTALLPGMQSTSVSLQFDRTYEVACIDALPAKLQPYRESLTGGVYADVRALETLVGLRDGYGPVQPWPLNIYFGASGMLDIGANSTRPLGFYGYMTGFNVTYTHFSHTMTPVRAIVNCDFLQLTFDDNGEVVYPESGDAASGDGSEVTQ